MYEVIPVDPASQIKLEAMGSRTKYWMVDPMLGFALFKLIRPATGEDWAEKVAKQVCRLLGLPRAV